MAQRSKTTKTAAKAKPKAKAKPRRSRPVKREPEYPWAQPTPPVDDLPEGFLPNLNPNQGRTY